MTEGYRILVDKGVVARGLEAVERYGIEPDKYVVDDIEIHGEMVTAIIRERK